MQNTYRRLLGHLSVRTPDDALVALEWLVCLLNDGALAGNPKPVELERIVAPTFVASLEDDRFETAAAARHIASSVSGAELVIRPAGGHIWVGHNDDLFTRIDAFLRMHKSE